MHVTQQAINAYTMHYATVYARKATSPKCHVDDNVRITRKVQLRKDLHPIREKVFTISSIKATKPLTYYQKDTLADPVVQETFHEQELQLSVQEIFFIE